MSYAEIREVDASLRATPPVAEVTKARNDVLDITVRAQGTLNRR